MSELVDEQVSQFPLQTSIEDALKEDGLEDALAYIFLKRVQNMGVSKSSGDFKRFKKH
jgi:hypothetical protein